LNVAGAMKDADNLDAIWFCNIENNIIADGKAAQLRRKFGPRTPGVGIFRKHLNGAVNAFD
jgi:hypothetical protein